MSKIILITGATSGIGKACAEKFAKEGNKLIITGRRKERLLELKEQLERHYNVPVLVLNFDVRHREEVEEILALRDDSWKPVDILINNAGLALGKNYFQDASMEDWETMIDTNVKGLLYVTRAILPEMVSRNRGHIINLGSVAGDEVYEQGNVYCATKAAVDSISTAMRIDLLKNSIKVTNIKPGAADTEFSLVRFKGDAAAAEKVYQGISPLTGEDIADTIYYTTTLPAHVCINDLTITCIDQANGVYINRKQ